MDRSENFTPTAQATHTKEIQLTIHTAEVRHAIPHSPALPSTPIEVLVVAASDELLAEARRTKIIPAVVSTFQIDAYRLTVVAVKAQSDLALIIFDSNDPQIKLWIKSALSKDRMPLVIESGQDRQLFFVPISEKVCTEWCLPSFLTPETLMIGIAEGLRTAVGSETFCSMLGISLNGIENLSLTLLMPQHEDASVDTPSSLH